MDTYNHNKKVVLVLGKSTNKMNIILKDVAEIREWTALPIELNSKLKLAIVDIDALFITYYGRTVINEEFLQAAPRLRIIVQTFVGYEQVDLAACTQHGIAFCNATTPSVHIVAEMAMGLILAASRNMTMCERFARSEKWKNKENPPYLFGSRLYGAVIGILGMGNIGLAVAQIAQAFGMNVIYNKRYPLNDDGQQDMEFVSKNDLFARADIVVNLLPSNRETYNIINSNCFRLMKSTALFVNIGRGDTVNTEDLVKALQGGEIAKAALDVVNPEPLSADHPLFFMDNVIITPHIGGNNCLTWEEKNRQAAQNIVNYFLGESLLDCQNTEVLVK